MEYNTYTFDNGLRVIHLPSDADVVYCGYQIAAGARHEGRGEEGLAHFCEHVTFKGTERRNPIKIINELERVGGDVNAFTNKEDTVYYAAVLREHLPRAIDLLTDIVFHSTYPQEEIDKEVEVICDEIESYSDSPAELIYDDFENLVFRGHPLGHNILGTAEGVRRFTTADALRFTGKYYRPGNAVLFMYGGKGIDSRTRKLLGGIPSENPYREAQAPPPAGNPETGGGKGMPEDCGTCDAARRVYRRHLSTHQAHVMVGNMAYSAGDPRRWPLYLLNNIIGGPGMNARLNIVMRERHGLVYTVESSMAAYGDTGIWCVYFGCDAADVSKCLGMVRRELGRFAARPLSQARLAAAKKQLKGQLGVAADNRESFALGFGKTFLHCGRARGLVETYRRIDDVTPDDIRQAAEEVFAPGSMTTLIYD